MLVSISNSDISFGSLDTNLLETGIAFDRGVDRNGSKIGQKECLIFFYHAFLVTQLSTYNIVRMLLTHVSRGVFQLCHVVGKECAVMCDITVVAETRCTWMVTVSPVMQFKCCMCAPTFLSIGNSFGLITHM